MAGLVSTLGTWPKVDGWVLLGFVFTTAGFVVGVVALVLTSLIYHWTNRTDSDRHSELTDALQVTQDAVRDLSAQVAPAEAHLGDLSAEEERSLRGLLGSGEVVVRCARSGSGKGNHPWQAVTSKGRLLQVYTGGRRGGVHASELS
ncbi:MAG: hypothetical protein KKA32_01435 [Actinobacteria bacterium]|nr:hypothetical protein [Actinomycetota bacterium]